MSVLVGLCALNRENDCDNLCGQRNFAEHAQMLATFREELQTLVENEIKDANAILPIEHGFPAASCGASVKLVRHVKAERRVSTMVVDFFARNNSPYSGEFTTHQRHFFVLEPPMPVEPVPNMSTIREEMAAKQRDAEEVRFGIEIQQPYITERGLKSSIDFGEFGHRLWSMPLVLIPAST